MGATFRQALAATATLMSLAFALSTLERWLARRRPHEAAWTVSLFLFAAGSLALCAGTAFGWRDLSFRAFYLFGGVLNVPFLALGTVYLLGGPTIGRRAAMGLSLVAAFAAGVIAVSPIVHPVQADVFPTGKDHFGVLPRLFAGVGSGIAALVIIGGALWSAARLFMHRREANPGLAPGRLAAANVLIAVGTIVISFKSAFESLGDDETAFAAALAVGITIIFAGFLLTNTSAARPDAGEEQPAAIPASVTPELLGTRVGKIPDNSAQNFWGAGERAPSASD
jgi:hypothetical protein